MIEKIFFVSDLMCFPPREMGRAAAPATQTQRRQEEILLQILADTIDREVPRDRQ
jgi:hypothetical protein